jgi:hypothetical protein
MLYLISETFRMGLHKCIIKKIKSRISRLMLMRTMVISMLLFFVTNSYGQLGIRLSDSVTGKNIRAYSLDSLRHVVESELNVKIFFDKVDPDSWGIVNYTIAKDTNSMLRYLGLLNSEYTKYPVGYFERVGVQTIALCTHLNYGEQNRAAIPDPYKHTLYLAIDGAYGDSSDIYLIHVMHHELNHCTEYALWMDMNYRWGQWRKINPFFFRYKGVGEMAYHDLSIDWYSMDHPRKGFINLYSTTAQEEDRSEIVADIMSDLERNFIIQYSETDKRLREKVKLIIGNLNEISRTTDNYWTDKMKEVINK